MIVHVDPDKIPQVVSRTPGSFPKLQTRSDADPIYDVIVCGGTLGIFVATALASKGLYVGVVERNILKGVLRSFLLSISFTIFQFHKKDNPFRLRLIL